MRPRVAPLSSKRVPPEPPPLLPSRLGSMTAATFSSAKNWAILSISACAPCVRACGPACRAEARRHCVHGEFGDVVEVLVGVALEERLIDRRHVAHGAKENDFSCQFAFVLVKILLTLNADEYHLAGDRAGCRGRPRCGLHNQAQQYRA